MLICVPAYAVYRLNIRIDHDLLTEKFYGRRAVKQFSSYRSLRLVADKEDSAVVTPQIVLQMMPYSARFAHTGGREDHLWVFIIVYSARIVACDRKFKPRKLNRIHAFCKERKRFLIVIFRHTAGIDIRCFNGERAIHINGKTVVIFNKILLFYNTYKVKKLLSSANGK